MNQSQKLNLSSNGPVAPRSFPQSKHEYWKPIISAWHDPGLSQSAFCRKNDLNLPSFTYWRAKILGKANASPQTSTAKPNTPPFVPVKTANTPDESELRVSLPNGIMVSGINEHNFVLLKAFLQAL